VTTPPPAGRASKSSILSRLQLGIEATYRVETQLDVEAFVIDDEERRRSGVARAPREQLVLREDDDELGMGLFIDREAIENLERRDPARGLDEENFSDFCLAVEGVSHFVYVALCAARERRVSALELELQAEVDKFVCCLFMRGTDHELRARLYRDVRFADDLDADERERYRTANGEASRYAAALERRFIRADRSRLDAGHAMLPELRRFYRMTLDDKLGHISRTAA
jgi:hypothetical protein